MLLVGCGKNVPVQIQQLKLPEINSEKNINLYPAQRAAAPEFYWVPQKLPQICTVILCICIGKVA